MKAVVLAGGEGIRLRPLTATTPKQLLPVAELTMLERVLSHLAAHDVDEVVLSMGYRPDAFLAAFPDDRCGGVALRYAVEPEPLDTAGAIRFAAEAAGLHERFLVVNGDVLTDLDVTALVAFHEDRGATATLALTRVEDPSMFGVVTADADGRVTAFVEKPPRAEAPSDLVNAGTYVLEAEVLDRIPAGRRVSVERVTFPALVDEGRLFASPWSGYWLDAGTPAKFLQANLDRLDGDGPPAPGAARRADGAWTLGAAVIDGELEAPALVGDAALVARGATVHRSVVGGGARVMDGAVVRRSVLLPGALVQAKALVEDSIVGEAGVVGEGAELLGGTVGGGHVEVAGGTRLVGARVPAGDG